jgi:hypothetical protein
MLGLGTSLVKGGKVGRTYVKDGLKLYMPYRGDVTNKGTQFVGTGSTSFDGTDDYIDCGSGSTIDDVFAGGGTICTWINPSSDGETSYGRIASKALNNGWELYVSDESSGSCKVRYYTDFSSNDGRWDTTNTDITINAWNHIAVTYDNGAVTNNALIYINGISVAVTEGSTPVGTRVDDSSQDLWIGDRNDSTKTFDGSIKNVAIWSRALTATEIQNVMYKSYAEVSGRLTDGLVSWWALDADSLGTELFTDGDMETAGVTNWGAESANASGDNLVKDTSIFYSGTQSLKVVRSGGNGGVGQDVSGITAGKTYQYSGRVYISTGSFYVSWNVDGGEEDLSDATPVPVITTTGSWIEFSHQFTAVENPLLVGGWLASGTTVYLDDLSLKEVSIEDLKGSNDGSIFGATVDEDLYGGDTPVKPRAIDNAPTVQADAIGAGSASFDGVDDYIALGISADDSNLTSGTITAWVKADVSPPSAIAPIISLQDPADASDVFLISVRGAVSNDPLQVMIKNNGSETLRSNYDNYTLAAGVWTHIAYTCDSTDGNALYVDGVLATASSYTTGSASTTAAFLSQVTVRTNGFQIGSLAAESRWHDGNICQVGLWSGALTQAQIQSVMEKTYEELTATEKTNLVSYWALDVDGTDSHGDNDGTLT